MRSKKLKLTLGGILLLLIIGLALTWYFRARVLEWVKTSVSDQMHVDVDFSNLQISLVKAFPKLSVSFEDLSLTGRDAFKGDTLFHAQTASLAIDAWSLLNKDQPVDVKKIFLDKPSVNLIVLDSGKANYLLYPYDSNAQSQSSEGIRLVELRRLEINDGRFSYTNYPEQQFVHFSHLNHIGRGSWSGVELLYHTKTSLDSLQFQMGTISYLKNVKLSWDADFDWTPDSMRLRIGKNQLHLNAMHLSSEGRLKFLDNRLSVQLKIHSGESPFKELFSILPNAYTKDFAGVKTSGFFTFYGNIDGDMYYEKDIYPDFDIKLKVRDGYVKYPGFAKAIERVHTDIMLTKHGPGLDEMRIDVPALKFEIDGDALHGQLHIVRPLSALDAKGKLVGTLDLTGISEAYPIEDVKLMKGSVAVDLQYHFNREGTEKYLAGNLRTKGILLKYSGMPDVQTGQMDIRFSPDKIQLDKGSLRFGNSDFSGAIKILEPLNYFASDGEVSVITRGKMKRLDADEWVSSGESPGEAEDASGVDAEWYAFLTQRFTFEGQVSVDELKYTGYDIRKLFLDAEYHKDRLTINDMKMRFSGSPLEATGYLDSLLAWLWMEEVLRGRLVLRSERFDMDKYMERSAGEPEEEAGEFELPDKMSVNVKVHLRQMVFDSSNYRNVRGEIFAGDRQVDMMQMQMEGLGGTMALEGSLKTPKESKPTYEMKFKGQKVVFSRLLSSVKPVHRLMPIFEFFQGALNTELVVSGPLEKDLSPDLTGLNARGYLETIQTFVENYPPMRRLGEKLRIKSLKEDQIPVNQVKTWFEINNGRVYFKPFILRYKNIQLQIEGSNSLDKSIDYTVLASIPTDILEKIPGHQVVKKGKDWMDEQMKKLGLDFKKNNRLKTRIHIIGPYNDPKLRIKLERDSGVPSMEEKGRALLDSAKSKMIDTLQKAKEDAVNRAKEEAEKKAKAARDSLRKKADEEIERAKQEAKEKLDKKASEIIDSSMIKKKTKETEEKVKKAAKKKAKEVLDKWNPFKRKKKG